MTFLPFAELSRINALMPFRTTLGACSVRRQLMTHQSSPDQIINQTLVARLALPFQNATQPA
jgi:hypothetical protein